MAETHARPRPRPLRRHRVHRRPDRRLPRRARPDRAALGAGRAQPGQARGGARPARRRPRPTSATSSWSSSTPATRPRWPTSCSRAKVAVTTVGPYQQLGGPLVAACAETGTDYVDLTGEPEFVDTTYVAQHQAAAGQRRAHRARVRLRLDPARPRRLLHRPASCRPTGPGRRCAASSAPPARASGGTFHSAMGAFSRAKQMAAAAKARRRAQGKPADGRSPRAPWPASPTATRSSATGCCRCRPSTRRSSRAAGPRCRRTARTSATPTTPAPRRCATPSAAWPGVSVIGVAAQVPPARNFLLKKVPAGPRARRGQAREVVVHRRVRRRVRRPHAAHQGQRRRPGLRRDGQDARRVGAVPGLRRQPADRRQRHHRPGDGRQPARPARAPRASRSRSSAESDRTQGRPGGDPDAPTWEAGRLAR